MSFVNVSQEEAAGKELVKSLKNKKVCYIDVPTYFNFGDILIYLGSLDLFNKNNVEVVGLFSAPQIIANPDLIKKSGAEVIVCQGGGNFGDLYPLHQAARKLVAEVYQDLPIIFFPQSCHYESKNNLERDKRLFSNHSNITAFARDESSLALFRDMGFTANLSIDTAHFIDKKWLINLCQPTMPHLNFFRDDKEKMIKSGESSLDWDFFFKQQDIFLKRLINQSSKWFCYSRWASSFLMKIWTYYCRRKLVSISKVLTQYQHIETDRLHVWIICKLLKVSVKNFDNKYGKINKYKKMLKNI